jgi:hypothetical protein
MVIQINAEQNDTVETATNAAVHVADRLHINVLFFWDRIPYEVTPGSDAAILAETINKRDAQKGK